MKKFSKAHDERPDQVLSASCPNCQSMYLDRVGRRMLDKVTSLIVPVRRYYCESCGWRGNLKYKSEQA